MKTVLCYGDSNTWGYNPCGNCRYLYSERWTSLLQEELGNSWLVIPEGLNGRTTVWDDPIEGHKNGATYLSPCLDSHHPLDLVVIMLGTNDLKARFALPACDIAAGVGALVDLVHKSGCGPDGQAPQVLVLIPPPLGPLDFFAAMFEGGVQKSKELARHYKRMANEKGVSFLDIGSFLELGKADGLHFEPEQLAPLAREIARKVREIAG